MWKKYFILVLFLATSCAKRDAYIIYDAIDISEAFFLVNPGSDQVKCLMGKEIGEKKGAKRSLEGPFWG